MKIRKIITLIAALLMLATATATAQSNTVTLTPETGEITLNDGDILSGKGGENTKVQIAAGTTITLSGVDITNIPNNSEHKWAGITCLGDATIILADDKENKVKGGYENYPGIFVPNGHTLTIKGGGTLEASSNGFGDGAGIGGCYEGESGNIVINGGTITASSKNGAGIGCGGRNGSCATITINGGTITASSQYGAGIGSGHYESSCGDITISGGTITASSQNGAGIGNGYYESSCGDITISGGTITASSQYGAGIGSGTITLGWTDAGNILIKASSFLSSKVNIKEGQKFVTEDGIEVSGDYVNVSDINGKKLYANPDEKITLTADNVTVATPQTYTGEDIEPVVVVTYDNKTLIQGPNYSVSYSDNKNVGKATATISFKGAYTGEDVVKKFEIKQKSLNDDDIEISIPDQSYTGAEIEPEPVVKFGKNVLTLGTDYTVSYTNNTNAGTATATITGKDNCTGTVQKEFVINKSNLANAKISGIQPFYFHTGDEIAIDYSVTSAEGTVLTKGTDFKATFSPETIQDVGEYTLTISAAGNDNYIGSMVVNFTVGTVNNVSISSETGEQKLSNDPILTGTGGENTHIIIEAGATVVLSGVDITNIPNNSEHKWAGITCLGDATIILADGKENKVKGGKDDYPGIFVPKGYTLTIKGGGTLKASCNGSGAGIGGCNYGESGSIVINGGTITASSKYGAGIGSGSGNGSSCDAITVNGGTITASSEFGAGIGSGSTSDGGGSGRGCDAITVNGGTITASSEYGAGIGNGFGGSCGTITLGWTNDDDYIQISGSESTGTVNIKKGQYFATENGTLITGKNVDISTFNGKKIIPQTAYTITYHLGDGATNHEDNPANYTKLSETFTLKDPTRDLYEFTGWTYDEQTEPVTDVTITKGTTGNKEFTANWRKILTDANVADIDPQTYTGNVIEPSVTVSDGDATLTPDKDYTVSYSANNNTGEATVTIDGINNYCGTVIKIFSILPQTETIGAITFSTDQNGLSASINGDYTDADALSIGKNIDVESVTLVRNFTDGKYATVVLPFKATPNADDGTFYTFGGVTYDNDKSTWVATVSSVATLEAHTPYIFEPNGNKPSLTWNVKTTIYQKTTSSATEVKDPKYGDWIFKGVYEPESWTDRQTKIYGFAGSDKTNNNGQEVHIGEFVRAGAKSSIKPFRCYLEYIGGGKEDLSALSKNALALPDRIEVRVVSSVIAPSDPSENPNGDIETPTSELTPSKSATARVWSYDKTIYISASPNTPYTIIDITGRPLRSGITATDRDEIHLSGSVDGIVIVRIANQSFKIGY